MAKNCVLVRNGRHMRPMLDVLTRYGIGSIDQYGRGRWISEKDIPSILDHMRSDPTAIWFCGQCRCEADKPGAYCYVDGTNRHNQVSIGDFSQLFGKV